MKLKQDVLENGQVKTTVRARRKQVVGWFAGAGIAATPVASSLGGSSLFGGVGGRGYMIVISW